ncbi:MAG: hypothetical protein EA408_12750, partial [Marinilabiliales bacterium]
MKNLRTVISLLILIALTAGISKATKFVSVLPVDNQILALHFQDGMVVYNWDDTLSGSCNGWDYYHTENWHLCPDKDQYVPFGEPLNAIYAQQPGSYLIISEDDPNYGAGGKSPVKVHRKSKVWEASHSARMPAMHHWIYLELPHPLKRGKMYFLEIDERTNSGIQLKVFNYDEFTMESPSIKISNIGYEAGAVQKTADVYLWMGDGG